MSAEESSPFRFKLTDEQKRIVATVRELTQGEFKPLGLQYMDGTFPWENIRGLADLGILGMAVPEAYGGSEFGAFDEALRYARERPGFGRPIGEFQGMRWKLATMYHDIEAGRWLFNDTAAT